MNPLVKIYTLLSFMSINYRKFHKQFFVLDLILYKIHKPGSIQSFRNMNGILP